MSSGKHAQWIGHPATSRIQLQGGEWQYADPRNQDLAFEVAKLDVSLPALDALIEAGEARGDDRANELRMRRSRATEEQATPAASIRHLQWIGKRLVQIESADAAAAHRVGLAAVENDGRSPSPGAGDATADEATNEGAGRVKDQVITEVQRLAKEIFPTLEAWETSSRQRISVAAAIEIIVANAPGSPALTVYRQADGSLVPGKIDNGQQLLLRQAMTNLVAFCQETGTIPRNPYAPSVRDFVGSEGQTFYEITADEFASYAATYGLRINRRGHDDGAFASEAAVADLPDALRKGYAEQAAAKASAGRYKLGEAAAILEKEAGERRESILSKLVNAAGEKLPTYEPGRNARIKYGTGHGESSRVRDFYDEVYWDELNRWLAKDEPRIAYRFPAPTVCAKPEAATAPGAGSDVRVVVVAADHDNADPQHSDSDSRHNWRAVAGPYIIAKQSVGKFPTAKALYRALEAEAGTEQSEFDKGGGRHESLIVRKTAKPLALKTLQNAWGELRDAANQK